MNKTDTLSLLDILDRHAAIEAADLFGPVIGSDDGPTEDSANFSPAIGADEVDDFS